MWLPTCGSQSLEAPVHFSPHTRSLQLFNTFTGKEFVNPSAPTIPLNFSPLLEPWTQGSQFNSGDDTPRTEKWPVNCSKLSAKQLVACLAL